MTRANFLRKILIAGIASQIPFYFSCSEEEIEENDILTNSDLKIIRSVQDILFPKYKDTPSAKEVKADRYLLWVLSDTKQDPDENEYVINGIQWLEETAIETFSESYLDLNRTEKEKLIKIISAENWGESWLSKLLTLIFEAAFSDPLYGSNPNKIGWKWIKHNPGLPRPTKKQIYSSAT